MERFAFVRMPPIFPIALSKPRELENIISSLRTLVIILESLPAAGQHASSTYRTRLILVSRGRTRNEFYSNLAVNCWSSFPSQIVYPLTSSFDMTI